MQFLSILSKLLLFKYLYVLGFQGYDLQVLMYRLFGKSLFMRKNSSYAVQTDSTDKKSFENNDSYLSNYSTISEDGGDHSVLPGSDQGHNRSSENKSKKRKKEQRYKKHKKRRKKTHESSCTANTIQSLFPKSKKPLPQRKDVYFVDEKGGMKKSYGPFKDDKKSPYYYPGLHQLDGKIGKKVVTDDKYRIHPVFMAKLAEGGFYERRIIKPKDKKGADVVEEKFGFFPKETEPSSSDTTSSSNSTSSAEKSRKPRKKRANPDTSMFNGNFPGFNGCVDSLYAPAAKAMDRQITDLQDQQQKDRERSDQDRNLLLNLYSDQLINSALS